MPDNTLTPVTPLDSTDGMSSHIPSVSDYWDDIYEDRVNQSIELGEIIYNSGLLGDDYSHWRNYR